MSDRWGTGPIGRDGTASAALSGAPARNPADFAPASIKAG